MVTELHAPDGRHARVMGNPITMADAPVVAHRFPPRLGEDSEKILRDVLGLAAGEVEKLMRSGVVSSPSSADEGSHQS